MLQGPAVSRVQFGLHRAQTLHERGVIHAGFQFMRDRMVFDHQIATLAQAFRHRFEDGLPFGKFRFLGNHGQFQSRRVPDLAVIRSGGCCNDAKKARLAGAIAADEAHTPARLDDQVNVIQQRHVAVGKRYAAQLYERHDSSSRPTRGI